MSIIYNFKVVVKIKMQCCCPFYKQYGSPHKCEAVLSLEPSCPKHALSSGFIAVLPPDVDQFPNIVNIVPSCPKKASVLGIPSAHVHHTAQGWPVKTLLLGSGTNTIEKERENLISQQLSLEEHSFL